MFSGPTPKLATASQVHGRVNKVDPHHGLSLTLPWGYTGHVALTDICDEYVDYPTTPFEEGYFFSFYVLECKEQTKHCECSLRPSRYSLKICIYT